MAVILGNYFELAKKKILRHDLALVKAFSSVRPGKMQKFSSIGSNWLPQNFKYVLQIYKCLSALKDIFWMQNPIKQKVQNRGHVT